MNPQQSSSFEEAQKEELSSLLKKKELYFLGAFRYTPPKS